jgi:DNA-directed RNA polymerase subunit beta'
MLPNYELIAYNYPRGRYLNSLSRWKKNSNQITEKVISRKIGQTIAIGRNFSILRQGTRILLDTNRLFPWKPSSVLEGLIPLTARRDRKTETGDITSGIPQIESLLEIRIQTGLPFFINDIYQKLLRKTFLHRRSTRKALHYGQRIIVDRVQRIYQTNGVSLNDKNLELIVSPIAFVQVIQDCNQKDTRETKRNYPLAIQERENWHIALKNWRKKEFLWDFEPKIIFKPLLLGLTKGALHNASFLSSASFQEASRILARAALRGRVDTLLGLKENLILGTRLPIGTKARFLSFSARFKDNFLGQNIATKSTTPRPSVKNSDKTKRKVFLLWPDAIYSESNSSIREEEIYLHTTRHTRKDNKHKK